MKYLKCGLNEVNGIFDTQCFHILCCNYYYAFYGNMIFLFILVLIFLSQTNFKDTVKTRIRNIRGHYSNECKPQH